MQILKTTPGQGWGMTAVLDGRKLTFSGIFDAQRIRAEKWGHVFPFLSPKVPTLQKNKTDVYSLFSPNAKQVWAAAFYSAKKRKGKVAAEDIFFALLEQPQIQELFRRVHASALTAKDFLHNYIKLQPPKDAGEELKKLPFAALSACLKFRAHQISPLLLLAGLMEVLPHEHIIWAIFSNISLSPQKLEVLIVWMLNSNYEFPPGSQNAKTLFCLRQAENLEKHFGYFFEFQSAETAAELSKDYYTDLKHLKSLKLLVKAGALAKNSRQMSVTENLIKQASH